MLKPKQKSGIATHAMKLYSALGLRSADFAPYSLEWANLARAEADVKREARAMLEEMKKDPVAAESNGLAEAHDGIMTLFDAIIAEMDERSKIGDRGPRPDPVAARRPMKDGVGDNVYDDEDSYRKKPIVAVSLRAGQSFEEHLRQNGYVTRSLRGLTEGAFLRSMVVGPKSDIEKRALSEGSDSARRLHRAGRIGGAID